VVVRPAQMEVLPRAYLQLSSDHNLGELIRVSFLEEWISVFFENSLSSLVSDKTAPSPKVVPETASFNENLFLLQWRTPTP